MTPDKSEAGRGLFARPYLLMVLTTMFWGGNAVAGKLAAGSISPLSLTAFRWIGAAFILYFLARPLLPAAMPVLRQRWRFIFACGATGFAIFNIALYWALNYTSAINVAIEQSGMPMVIILLTYVIYREPITALQGIGVILSMAGVLVTVTHGNPAAIMRLEVNVGDAIMMIAVLTYSIYSVALRHKPKLPWQVFMFGLALSAMIVSLPGLIFDIASGRLPAANWITPAVIFYVIIFPSLVSQIFFVRAVEMIGASRAGLFMNLVPVFGAASAVLILGESLRLYQVVGLVLVISGIALAETSARRRAARMASPPAS